MYVFDNAAPQAASRLGALAEMFDPGTIRHLNARGVAEGWRCLEVGGGGGTIARWLAEQVGPRGSVLTTDIDTRYLESLRLPNVEVRRHDVAAEPLPEAAFDLVHARLVLNAVPAEAGALARLARALKPGGWMVIEDFQAFPGGYEPADDQLERTSKTTSVMRQVIAAAGLDPQSGRTLPARLRACGLVDVDAEGRVFVWRAGTAGATLTRANREQLRPAMLATGLITDEELAADLAGIDEDDFETTSPILWAAWGRRPAP
jgi:SAM-dependent methyltransferase